MRIQSKYLVLLAATTTIILFASCKSDQVAKAEATESARLKDKAEAAKFETAKKERKEQQLKHQKEIGNFLAHYNSREPSSVTSGGAKVWVEDDSTIVDSPQGKNRRVLIVSKEAKVNDDGSILFSGDPEALHYDQRTGKIGVCYSARAKETTFLLKPDGGIDVDGPNFSSMPWL